jgi:hypothetical protein
VPSFQIFKFNLFHMLILHRSVAYIPVFKISRILFRIQQIVLSRIPTTQFLTPVHSCLD